MKQQNIKEDLKNINDNQYFIKTYGEFLANYYRLNTYIQYFNNHISIITRKLYKLEDEYDNATLDRRYDIIYKMSESRNTLATWNINLQEHKEKYEIEKASYELAKLDEKLQQKQQVKTPVRKI